MSRRKRVRGQRKKGNRGFGSWPVWRQLLVILGSVLVLLITVGVVFAAFKLGKIETTKLDVSKLNISREVERNETGYLNVALFGLDSREGGLGKGERSDTIMIASLNRETKEIKVSSVYRDTFTQQADGSYNKINAAYSLGGAEGAVATLNKNMDMDIQHYVAVNFNALVDVIDELGGIEVDLTPEEVHWTNGYGAETSKVTGKKTTDLTQPGKQTLDGVQGTSYCRIRTTAGDDFKRAERQRTVLEQIIRKVQKVNLSTLNRLTDKVFPKVETNFTLTEILAYAKDASKYELGDMNGFPFDKTTPNLSGVGSTVVPESLQSNVVKLHKFFFGENGYTPSSTVVSISAEIRNYGGSSIITPEEAAAYDIEEGLPPNPGGESGNTGTTLPDGQGEGEPGGEVPQPPETTETLPEGTPPPSGGTPPDDSGGVPSVPPEGNAGGTPDGPINQGSTENTN